MNYIFEKQFGLSALHEVYSEKGNHENVYISIERVYTKKAVGNSRQISISESAFSSLAFNLICWPVV